jgi:hypothetical protein
MAFSPMTIIRCPHPEDYDMNRYRSQVREVINRNIVVSLALEQGFNAYLPVYDGGIDFILCRESDGQLLQVQLKGRLMIDKKYIGRNIWMAFPISDDWYLMPHDKILALAEADGKTTRSKSWAESGAYSWPKPSAAMIGKCKEFRFSPLATVVAKASNEESS